jgi:hypothetical protein
MEVMARLYPPSRNTESTTASWKVVPNPAPDTVSIIDLKTTPPRVMAEVQAPVSVTGPPLSVAITPDESLALVTASNTVDPSDRTKQTPNNQVPVIDFKASPPRVIATLEAGKGAAGVSINRQGTLALVSNMVDGTVSIFTIQGKTVAPAGTLEVGGAQAGGGMVAFTSSSATWSRRTAGCSTGTARPCATRPSA